MNVGWMHVLLSQIDSRHTAASFNLKPFYFCVSCFFSFFSPIPYPSPPFVRILHHIFCHILSTIFTFICLFVALFFFPSLLLHLFNRNRDAHKYTDNRQLQDLVYDWVNKFIPDFGRWSRILDESIGNNNNNKNRTHPLLATLLTCAYNISNTINSGNGTNGWKYILPFRISHMYTDDLSSTINVPIHTIFDWHAFGWWLIRHTNVIDFFQRQ